MATSIHPFLVSIVMRVFGSAPRRWGRHLPRLLATYRDDKRFGLLAVFIVFVAHAWRYFASEVAGQVHGDGFYSWIFVRSLAFDGDLDFSNDYAACGDPWGMGVDEGGGRPANPFYFGPAVLLAPVLFIVRHVIRLPAGAPASWHSGCTGPLIFYTGLLSIVAVTLVVYFGYRAARRFFDEGTCAIAVLVVGFASPLNVHGSFVWYYSHVWSALGVALTIFLTVRFWETPSLGWAAAAGAACGFAFLMRPVEILFACAFAAAMADHARRGGVRRMLRSTVARTLAFGGALLGVAALQFWVHFKLYGFPFIIPQGKLYVQLSHAHPFLLLFGARSGLLYWTPLMWFAVLGLPLLVRPKKSRFLFAGLVLVTCLHHYIASSALGWTGAATTGGRVQTSLAAPFLLSTAAFLTPCLRWLERREWTRSTGALVTVALLPWVLVTWGIPTAGVPYDRPVPAPDLYGTAVRGTTNTIYTSIGNPWTLPATILFALRYRASPAVFDTVATDGIFQKQYRSLAPMGPDTLSFASPPAAYFGDGYEKTDQGARITPGRRMRSLFALYWPWVTHIHLSFVAEGRPANVTLRTGSFFRRYDLGSVHVEKTTEVDLAVPKNAFDSGIDELLVETDARVTLKSIRFIDQGKRDTRVRAF
ncbi:glycosyltransferase family 39 protein [Pendulispora rubella]|uniref:Glycosyltransferase family 39 protein n=1 Tax=Pendulispora rubella TaxID=2741070 RepID=A0ABZ2L3X1_9BACT